MSGSAVFELEIMRDLLRDVDETQLVSEAFDAPRTLTRYRHRISLLPKGELPFWRKVMDSQDGSELAALIGLGEEYINARKEFDIAKQKRDLAVAARRK